MVYNIREYTPQEAAALAGANLSAVQKALTSKALPVRRRDRRRVVDAATVLTLAAAARMKGVRVRYGRLRAVIRKAVQVMGEPDDDKQQTLGLVALDASGLVKLDLKPIQDVVRSMRLYDRAVAELIAKDPAVKGGTPVIRGTRLSVYALRGRIEDGDTAAGILKEYPYLSEEQLEAALLYAHANPLRGRPMGKPWRRTRRLR
jgi:uncharacterized protein (DUF433 family)